MVSLWSNMQEEENLKKYSSWQSGLLAQQYQVSGKKRKKVIVFDNNSRGRARKLKCARKN